VTQAVLSDRFPNFSIFCLHIRMSQIIVRKEDIKLEGFLEKQSKVVKNWRTRWLVLTCDFLCAFKTNRDYDEPTEHIRLAECLSVKSAEKDTGMENSFCVVTEDRTFLLIASSAAEKEVWMSTIMDLCLPMLIRTGLLPSVSKFTICEDELGDSADPIKGSVLKVSRKEDGPWWSTCSQSYLDNVECFFVNLLVPSLESMVRRAKVNHAPPLKTGNRISKRECARHKDKDVPRGRVASANKLVREILDGSL